jgi:hypothetical protein
MVQAAGFLKARPHSSNFEQLTSRTRKGRRKPPAQGAIIAAETTPPAFDCTPNKPKFMDLWYVNFMGDAISADCLAIQIPPEQVEDHFIFDWAKHSFLAPKVNDLDLLSIHACLDRDVNSPLPFHGKNMEGDAEQALFDADGQMQVSTFDKLNTDWDDLQSQDEFAEFWVNSFRPWMKMRTRWSRSPNGGEIPRSFLPQTSLATNNLLRTSSSHGARHRSKTSIRTKTRR